MTIKKKKKTFPWYNISFYFQEKFKTYFNGVLKLSKTLLKYIKLANCSPLLKLKFELNYRDQKHVANIPFILNYTFEIVNSLIKFRTKQIKNCNYIFTTH